MSSHPTSLLNNEQIKSIQTCLNENLLKKLNKAVVFLDHQFVEWFNLTTGMDALIRVGGAVNLKEFSPFQNGGESLKGVFLISRPLKGAVLDTLKEIVISSRFQFVTIVTNIRPESYDESEDYLDRIRDECLMWMSNVVSN
jgi:hypothetical protein